MSKLKKYFRWFLIFLIFYFASNLLSVNLIKSAYRDKKVTVSLNPGDPEITITESKATITNGYVEGKITNTSKDTLKGKYVKIDAYSKNGTKVRNQTLCYKRFSTR